MRTCLRREGALRTLHLSSDWSLLLCCRNGLSFGCPEPHVGELFARLYGFRLLYAINRLLGV
jgi:hypothetical protein